jgi:hypothetical protein
MPANTRHTGLLLALALAAGHGAGSPAPGARPAPAAFERLTGLAGDWEAAEDGEMARKGDLVARYAVTAAGTAVVETVFPGSPHEMVTVYHPDGDDVVLTHYCVEGNQPRMRARNAAGPRLRFAFDGGAGIDPARDRHMHEAVLEILGPDEIRTQWTELQGGQTALVVRSHLRRRTR